MELNGIRFTENTSSFSLKFSEITEKEVNKYKGEYTVEPTGKDIVLPTKDLMMTDDVTVKAVPEVPQYDGTYEVSPSAEEQTLATNGKQMSDNVVVHAVPVFDEVIDVIPAASPIDMVFETKGKLMTSDVVIRESELPAVEIYEGEYVINPSTEDQTIPKGNWILDDSIVIKGYIEKEILLQDKSVTPTDAEQTVKADEGYDGLGTVTVGASTGGSDEWKEVLVSMITNREAIYKLPDGITKIDNYAFYQCTKLALTSLPDGITSIGHSSFYRCTKLALTSLPDGITKIDNYAFYQCTELALTSLPESVTSIGQGAFYQCTELALTSLPDGITRILRETFYMCTSLALTKLPESVTNIDSYAFRDCSKMSLTSLPESVTSIGSYAFLNCRITELHMGATPPSISYSCFPSSLTKIYIPQGSLESYQTKWKSYSSYVALLEEE